MKRLCYILILLSMFSCYSVKNGKPIPWFDNYKLKDKNTIIPTSLDTNNIYMLKESYDLGKLVYSDSLNIENKNIALDYIQKELYFIKFYSDGRCQTFSIKKNDSSKLTEEDLNPENYNCQYHYYYFIDSNFFQIETFSKAVGGTYVIKDFKIENNGLNIISVNPFFLMKYEIYYIPKDWKKYNYIW